MWGFPVDWPIDQFLTLLTNFAGCFEIFKCFIWSAFVHVGPIGSVLNRYSAKLGAARLLCDTYIHTSDQVSDLFDLKVS